MLVEAIDNIVSRILGAHQQMNRKVFQPFHGIEPEIRPSAAGGNGPPQLIVFLAQVKGAVPAHGVSKEKYVDVYKRQVDVQREGFQRLGVIGDWEHPYLTMNPSFEAEEVKVFGAMYKKGYIYKGFKPCLLYTSRCV